MEVTNSRDSWDFVIKNQEVLILNSFSLDNQTNEFVEFNLKLCVKYYKVDTYRF
jgi:hypothetical protein